MENKAQLSINGRNGNNVPCVYLGANTIIKLVVVAAIMLSFAFSWVVSSPAFALDTETLNNNNSNTEILNSDIEEADASIQDNCGSDDRDPLPSCAVQGGSLSNWKDVKNNCSYPITVKVDVRNFPDELETIAAGGFESFLEKDTIRGIYCCPRYNRCS